MKNLVEGYWEQNSQIIKKYCFMPWLLYLVVTNILFAYILQTEPQENDSQGNLKKYSVSISGLILFSYQMWIEFQQLGELSLKGLKAYLGFWNIIDLLQLISMVWITLSNLQEGGSSHKEGQRIIAAFSIFILWLKFFDWLRMFESTAFYVSLL